MGDHFDISGVFETTEFEIAKSACMFHFPILVFTCSFIIKRKFSKGFVFLCTNFLYSNILCHFHFFPKSVMY